MKQNLKPFKPGQSGNPNGRPKKLPGLDQLLAESLGEDGSEMLAILKSIIKKAKAGDVRAAEYLSDRYYGKPKNYIDMTGSVDHRHYDNLDQWDEADLRTIISLNEKYKADGN